MQRAYGVCPKGRVLFLEPFGGLVVSLLPTSLGVGRKATPSASLPG